uniref:Uncharacterized protein n=1 Tax=Acanthochromis polyacanthus TaxID=80966 RepID=A0A3Q1EY74_9TELE
MDFKDLELWKYSQYEGRTLIIDKVIEDEEPDVLRRSGRKSDRMEDQRCSLPDLEDVLGPVPEGQEDFFSLVQRVQSRRMDEQRASMLRPPTTSWMSPQEPSGLTASSGSGPAPQDQSQMVLMGLFCLDPVLSSQNPPGPRTRSCFRCRDIMRSKSWFRF